MARRQISNDAAAALINNKNFKRDNTEVVVSGRFTRLFLFNNRIAEHDNDYKKIRLVHAGWPTETTKDRLNAILEHKKQAIKIVKRGEAFYISDAQNKLIEWPGIIELDA
jgi:hypothetical protein